jgi:hypothetical protein
MVAENPGAVAIEQPGCGMDETGRPRTPPPVDGGGNVMVLRSARPGEAIVRQLLAKYGIETAREHKHGLASRDRRGCSLAVVVPQ